jgi:hypothetical protein
MTRVSRDHVGRDDPMRAHRTRVHVDTDHELRVTLPRDFPVGEAEVTVVQVPRAPATTRRRLTVDELLAARLTPPPGVGAVSLDDIERAIAAGASGLRSL